MNPLAPALPAPRLRPTAEIEVSPHRRFSWQRFGGKFLVISVLAHLLFGAVAAYLVVQTIQAKRKLTFQSGPKGPTAATRALEHKVQTKKQNARSAPPQAKRVTTTGLSKVALPDMPAMPSMNAALSPGAISGMGAAGLAPGGLGGGVGGMGGSGGAGINFFGARTGGAGLSGTFYDYKMDQAYQPVKPMGNGEFAHVVHDVLPLTGAWHPDQPYRHFTSPAKLYGKYFFFPAIQDTEAGASFQSPRSGPGRWLAVYRGRFLSPVTGSFRFVGFGDNVMIVKVAGRIVLDASDHGYTGMKREALGNISFPAKGATPLFGGDWINLDTSEAKDIEVAVGDEGGIFCSGLFIQPKNVKYAQGEKGVPKLPVFMLGAPSEADRQLLGKAVSVECLQGPYFRTEAPHATSDIFSH